LFSEMEKIIMNGKKVGRWKEKVLIRSYEKLRGAMKYIIRFILIPLEWLQENSRHAKPFRNYAIKTTKPSSSIIKKVPSYKYKNYLLKDSNMF